MNWKVRIKNPVFWATLIPAVLLVIQTVLVPFGVCWAPTPLAEQLVAIVNAVFGVLVILGVVVDMTTSGIGDSDQAMTYDAPKVGKHEVM